MNLFVSSDYGKTWFFVESSDNRHRERLLQTYFKAGYATRILCPMDHDYFAFLAKAIFPLGRSNLSDSGKPTNNT